MIVHDFHQSGRHDAKDWDRAVDGATERGSVGSFTEAKGRRLAPEGWDQYAGGTESVILWDRSEWRPRASLPVRLTDLSWELGPGHVRTCIDMPVVLLEHRRTGLRYLRGAFHLCSSIQGGTGWSQKPQDADNVRVAKDALGNLGPHLRALQRLLRPDETTIAADWNVHLGLPAWRTRINTALDGTGLVVRPTREPTHRGGRTIDAHATSMRLARTRTRDELRVRTLPPVPDFDHAGIVGPLTPKEN